MSSAKWLAAWLGVWLVLSMASDMTSDSAGSRQFVDGLAITIATGATYVLGKQAMANITGGNTSGNP